MGTFAIDGHEMLAPVLPPAIYVVATPIGNLADITLRALKTLASADIVACEDTRMSSRLLNHYGIKAKMIAFHEHNEIAKSSELIKMVEAGKSVALISDAGTPLVSDPGFKLVEQATSRGIKLFAIPGPSAVIAALSACGLPTDRFLFAGFLPPKQAARRASLDALVQQSATLIFYESPKRLVACLDDIASVLGEKRQVRICRELTKLHEEIASGSATELVQAWSSRSIKGEIVLVVEGATGDNIQDVEALLSELLKKNSVSRAASEAAELTGLPKRQLYQKALKLIEANNG